MKNEYIVKFEFENFYVQFRNNPVGRRKVFSSESDEVEKSDVCIQEIQQRCNKHEYERDGENLSDAKCHVYHCRYFSDRNLRILCTHTVQKNI